MGRSSFPVAAETPTPTPTSGALIVQPTSPLLALTPVLGLTPLPTQPSIVTGPPPPLTIQLPAGWKGGFFIIPNGDQLNQRSVNVAIYQGPIQNSTATIVILWNFGSTFQFTPKPGRGTPTATATPTTVGTPGLDPVMQSLWLDGLRLLQGTVFDISCNPGHYGVRQDFKVGGLAAIGENFTVSQCQDGPDTVGWFAGVHTPYGNRLLFYVYVDPFQTYNDVHGDLQKILDSVVFQPPPTPIPTLPVTPTNTPTRTPRPAVPTNTPKGTN